MNGLESLDVALFRFINGTLSNAVGDRVMPWLSGNALFVPAAVLGAVWWIWKGGFRGRMCLAMLALALAVGDGGICRTLKRTVGRVRPCHVVPDARLVVGCSDSGSMPSSHAANWFAAAAVVGCFYRRRWIWVAAIGGLVAFSRVYNGVHYPSDVLVGALLGAGYGAGLVWLSAWLWGWAGRRWFPLWHVPFPARWVGGGPAPVVESGDGEGGPGALDRLRDAHWHRLGVLVILVLLVFRWWYLASGTIELSEDEAYQWVWSKHLDLSYFSKPPLIAYLQFVGTSLWGNTEFGVRFLSPLIAAVLSWLLLRFFAREVNARAGFWLVAIAATSPMLSVGSTLLTVDPPSVLFWVAAMISGWRAVNGGRTADWAWTGLWMGLGFLSKYTAAIQWLSWVCFLALWPPARAQLRRAGPYLALAINAVCTLPVVWWNARHGWITVEHLKDRGGLDSAWHFTPKYLGEFLGAELGLLNPVFFVAAVWAAVAFWRRFRREPFALYLWSMGAPLFLFYLFYTLRARVLPNWIAPAVVPLFCLMVWYWDRRFREGDLRVRRWLAVGIGFGLVVGGVLHDTRVIATLTGRALPERMDPLDRVRGWRATAAVVERERARLAEEGAPVFLIGAHYGITGLMSFYIPEAQAGIRDQPLVYYVKTAVPGNQFYFWPSYEARRGQTALYITYARKDGGPPPELKEQFESVTLWGTFPVEVKGRKVRDLRLYACRGLR